MVRLHRSDWVDSELDGDGWESDSDADYETPSPKAFSFRSPRLPRNSKIRFIALVVKVLTAKSFTLRLPSLWRPSDHLTTFIGTIPNPIFC